MTLLDLRKLSIQRQTTIRFPLRNGMECVITEQGVAQVPACRGVPDFNLETELAEAQEFQLAKPAAAAGKGAKETPAVSRISRAELAAMASGGSAGHAAEPDHDDE